MWPRLNDSGTRPLWQSALIFLGVGAALIVGGSILFVLIIFPEHCDEAERVLVTDPTHGAIVLKEALCTSLGSTDIESIQWVPPGGRGRMIFQYETPGGILSHQGVPIKYPITPSVMWRGASDLHIAISAVGSIIEKQNIVSGVHISYDIGLVVYP